MGNEKIGSYAFLAGVALAIVSAIFAQFFAGLGGAILLVLVVLGLVVGFLNISDKEVEKFLIATIALAAVGGARLTAIDAIPGLQSLYLGTMLQNIVVSIAVFVAPAALIVALKSIYSLAGDK